VTPADRAAATLDRTVVKLPRPIVDEVILVDASEDATTPTGEVSGR